MTDVPPVPAQQRQPRKFSPPASGESLLIDGHYYFIGAEIGKGAFGTVYECSDEWRNRLVAKVLMPRDLPYEEIRENWNAEIQKLLQLRHPNVTFIHNACEYKDTFYLILERCSHTLEDVINFPGLTPDLWIPWVARDVLQGLNYIHTFGYVHKDIHPGNVFVAETRDLMVQNKETVWSFKIGDLGISRLETEMKVMNTLLAQWMLPPEALDPDKFGPIGRTVDVYHVGLLLLALANKSTPSFTHQEILNGEPRKMAEASTSKFAPVIAKALRRHVAARTPTALQFWRDISSITGQS